MIKGVLKKMSRSNQLEEIRGFVTRLMLDEQDKHSKLVNELRSRIDYSNDIFSTLLKIHEAKIEVYNTILDKIKDM